MTKFAKFTKLMKAVFQQKKSKKQRIHWIVDQSKCMSMPEVEILRKTSQQAKSEGIRDRRFSHVRTWLLIQLGLHAGLRVGEMASLKHGDLLIDDSRSSIVVLGKGNKKRAIWISSQLKQACQTYLAHKNKFGFENGSQTFLLNNPSGNNISRRALQKAFKTLLLKAGLPNYYYVHCLRHTYATFLLKASNYNYRFVQQQLGHSSIRTTQIYANVLESDGREAIEKLYK